jgi:hypothetical protein
MTIGARLRSNGYEIFSVLAGLALFALAHANRLTFPFPRNDEARFYLPAWWWAKYGTLSPLILHAPRGIFWVPDGFTIFLGLAMKLFGETIEVARAVCEWSVAAGVVVFALAFRRITGSAFIGALATLWLLTPPVVFAANMVRMEAPLFLVIAVAVLLHVHGNQLAAASLLWGSLLFHPALGFAAVAYTGTAWINSRRKLTREASGYQWIFFLVVIAGLLWEAVRVLHHLDLFHAHMAHQATRKMKASLISKFSKPQGVLLAMSCAAIGWSILRVRRIRQCSLWESIPLVALTLGIQLYAVWGAEMAYDVYSLSVAPAIMFCIVVRSFTMARPIGLREDEA